MVLHLAERLGLRLMRSGGMAPSGRRGLAEAALLVTAGLVDLAFWGGGTPLRWGGDVPVLVVAGSAVLLLAAVHRRADRPFLAFGAAAAYTTLWGVLLPTYEPFTALLLTTYHLARRLPATRTWRAVPFLAVAWGVNTYNGANGTGAGVTGTAGIAFVWCGITAGAWMAGRHGRRTDEIARLREASHAAHTRLAVQEDRLRLAAELHDIVAHSISAIALQAAGARVAADPGSETAEALARIQATSTHAVREMRRLLGFLHETADDASAPAGGTLQDLELAVDTARACGVRVRVHQCGDARSLGSEADHVAYRVVQESLANVVKHRGRGSSADLALHWRDGCLVVEVSSTGGEAGSTPDPGHGPSGFGLVGLGARLRAVGGALECGPESDQGYRVVARLPLAA